MHRAAIFCIVLCLVNGYYLPNDYCCQYGYSGSEYWGSNHVNYPWGWQNLPAYLPTPTDWRCPMDDPWRRCDGFLAVISKLTCVTDDDCNKSYYQSKCCFDTCFNRNICKSAMPVYTPITTSTESSTPVP